MVKKVRGLKDKCVNWIRDQFLLKFITTLLITVIGIGISDHFNIKDIKSEQIIQKQEIVTIQSTISDNQNNKIIQETKKTQLFSHMIDSATDKNWNKAYEIINYTLRIIYKQNNENTDRIIHEVKIVSGISSKSVDTCNSITNKDTVKKNIVWLSNVK